MKRRRSVKPLQVSKNLPAFLKEFLTERSDRATALLGHSAIDDLIAELIRRHMRQDCETVDILLGAEGALGSYSARVNYLYATELIGLRVHKELHNLNKIRRAFAHRVFTHDHKGDVATVTFESASISDLCRNFAFASYCATRSGSLSAEKLFKGSVLTLLTVFWAILQVEGQESAFLEILLSDRFYAPAVFNLPDELGSIIGNEKDSDP